MHENTAHIINSAYKQNTEYRASSGRQLTKKNKNKNEEEKEKKCFAQCS